MRTPVVVLGCSMPGVQAPHPFQYQGSKRALAPDIAQFIPRDVQTFFEPFAGSAAMSLHVAINRLAHRIVIADLNAPLMCLWESIVDDPQGLSDAYEGVWRGHFTRDEGEHFNAVRSRFNRDRQPEDLLYIIARTVAGAIRYNAQGEYNQSRDKRRLGTKPERMRSTLAEVSGLLQGAEIRSGDFTQTTLDAGPNDLVYLDPPYQGTTGSTDRRYYEGMPRETFIEALESFNARELSYIVSYDGRTGDKSFGAPLPDRLGLFHTELHAGRSTQSTLSGRQDDTVESLYLSPALLYRLGDVTDLVQQQMPLLI